MCLDSVSGLRGTGEGGHLIICKWQPAADGVEQMQVCGKVPVPGISTSWVLINVDLHK